MLKCIETLDCIIGAMSEYGTLYIFLEDYESKNIKGCGYIINISMNRPYKAKISASIVHEVYQRIIGQ